MQVLNIFLDRVKENKKMKEKVERRLGSRDWKRSWKREIEKKFHRKWNWAVRLISSELVGNKSMKFE